MIANQKRFEVLKDQDETWNVTDMRQYLGGRDLVCGYVDDLGLSTPADNGAAMDRLGVKAQSLFRKPECREEYAYLFHLTSLIKLLMLLERRGLALNIKKIIVSLWQGLDFLVSRFHLVWHWESAIR